MQNAIIRDPKTFQELKPNILFFNEFEVSPNFGGIERVTSGIASILIEDNYSVYSAFVNYIPKEYKRANFSGKVHVNISIKTNIVNYLNDNSIDIIILQNTFKHINYISSVVKQCNRSIKLIFTHHMLPKSEYCYLQFYDYKKTLFKNNKNICRDVLRLAKWFINFPLVKTKWRKTYKAIYEKCDSVVLLSKEYVNNWKDFAKLNSLSKFRVIPNPRTFDHSFKMTDYEKYKQIELDGGSLLIVSRLYEGQKRVSIALNIFRRIEERYPKWHLFIIGDGPDIEMYKAYVKENNLHNVHFEGLQQPLSYYMNSSIFLMTSDHEAFPLTLLEAQQMGCVPMAFNTFGSVNTIIKNNDTGFIIAKGDIVDYYKHLELLIENPTLRKKMAKKAIKHSENFMPEIIVKQWKDLFLSLMK